MKSECARLFFERAVAVQSGFRVSEENAPAIAQICKRLDGIPLAIELAAARVRVLTPDQIAARLDNRFALLTGGSRTALRRQQTLRNAIDWSYHLLKPEEQKLFARLGVFVGGWELDAIEVCRVEGEPGGDFVDGLQTLVDHSLVGQGISSGGGIRFSMLETLREYALEQLQALGEIETLRQRQANYFLEWVDRGFPKRFGDSASTEWIRQLQPEQENVRAAFEWSQTRTDAAQMGLRLSLALGFIPNPIEHRIVMERALKHATTAGGYDIATRAFVLSWLGHNQASQGDFAAGEENVLESFKLFQEIGDRQQALVALEKLGWFARERGDFEVARSRLEQVLAEARELKLDQLIDGASTTLAETMILQGETALARQRLGEILPEQRRRNDVWPLFWTLNHLGHAAQVEGEYEQARQWHEESLPLILGIIGYGWELTVEGRYSLGETMLALGDVVAARTHLSSALSEARDSGYLYAVVWCLAALAGAAALDEEPERAAFLWGAAEQRRVSLGVRHGTGSGITRERLMNQVRAQLGEAAFAEAWAKGQTAPIEDVIKDALHGGSDG